MSLESFLYFLAWAIGLYFGLPILLGFIGLGIYLMFFRGK